jgi:hypothetical protein
MKKHFLAIVLTLTCHFLFSQVNPPTQVQPVSSLKLPPIPATKAITIRKDTRDLNSTFGKLYDSMTVIKKQMDALMISLGDEAISSKEMMAEAQQQIMGAMSDMQMKFQTASRMMQQIDSIRRGIMNAWPTSR